MRSIMVWCKTGCKVSDQPLIYLINHDFLRLMQSRLVNQINQRPISLRLAINPGHHLHVQSEYNPRG
jgi:hypothetical protein